MKDDDLDRELRVHLEIEAEELRARGLPEEEARDAARRALGRQARIKEEIHDQSRSLLVDGLTRDVQYGVRMLRRHPTFALVVAATLALGVAASTALFTIVHNVLMRPLAVPESDRVVLVYNSYPKAGIAHAGAAAADYTDRLRDVTVFDEQALFNYRNPSVEIGGVPERVHAMHATASFFRLLRVSPREGRAIIEEEEAPGRNRVVVLSAGLERRLFADGGAVGRSVRIDAEPYTVVGVMPRGFSFIDADVQMWLPLALTPRDRAQLHANNWVYLGRLKAGATLAQAQAQVDAASAADLSRHPELRAVLANAGFHVVAVPLQDDLVREMRSTVALLWAGSLFVLVTGSVNVASLVLARSRTRVREIATRVALGAGRWRIARQLAIEHLLLTTASGAAGIVLASAALGLFARIRIEHLPPETVTHIDGVVVAYTIVTIVVLGVVLGVVPICGGIFSDSFGALRDDGRTATSMRGRTLRRALVVAQISAACILLSGAGLLLASFRLVSAIDPGFDGGQTLTASIELPTARYPDAASVRRFTAQALEAIRALPGAASVGATNAIPFGSEFATRLIVAEGYRPAPGESWIGPYRNVITPGYFETMRVGLVSGRLFSDDDTGESLKVVIVDTTLARRFWPGVDPVGRRLFFPEDRTDMMRITERTPIFVVVGVVREVKLRGLVEGVGDIGAYYFPQAQAPERRLTFTVRTAGDPSSLGHSIRRAIAGVDRELPVFDVQPMIQRAEQSLASRRTATRLAVAFGVVALLLAAIGIYGVLAYLVAQRTKEIGIRVALGSSRAAVFRMVLGEGLLLIAAGAAIGAACAPFVARSIQSQLFGIRGSDPLILASAVVTLVFVGLVACVVPARRATRIDPVVALSE